MSSHLTRTHNKTLHVFPKCYTNTKLTPCMLFITSLHFWISTCYAIVNGLWLTFHSCHDTNQVWLAMVPGSAQRDPIYPLLHKAWNYFSFSEPWNLARFSPLSWEASRLLTLIIPSLTVWSECIQRPSIFSCIKRKKKSFGQCYLARAKETIDAFAVLQATLPILTSCHWYKSSASGRCLHFLLNNSKKWH